MLSRPRSTNHAGIAYNDGVITKWGTLEKCYSHTELKHFIENTLGVPARYLTHNTYTISHNSKALSLIIYPIFFPCKAACTRHLEGAILTI
ncbi:hypothetical protein [Microcoleus sp. Pol7_B1]|uniref:hypothetical protein n=1 Tax=Microcoleus sp. Pol7_B1 TaxID=2818894 RepID=UPI002FD33AA5